MSSTEPTVGRARRQAAVKPHRAFDPRVVGRLETTAWVAYYRHEWLKLLRASIGLTRRVFGLSWPATLKGAWYVLRANQQWAPVPNNDPDGARRTMERFYRLVKLTHGEKYDPVRAAALEVEWWRVHREHQHSEGSDDRELVRALAGLYAYVYGVSEAEVEPAARARAEAMDISDRWVAEGCRLDDPAIAAERAALVRSYAALLSAVHR
jgi:hypothetical protein